MMFLKLRIQEFGSLEGRENHWGEKSQAIAVNGVQSVGHIQAKKYHSIQPPKNKQDRNRNLGEMSLPIFSPNPMTSLRLVISYKPYIFFCTSYVSTALASYYKDFHSVETAFGITRANPILAPLSVWQSCVRYEGVGAVFVLLHSKKARWFFPVERGR
jgi:hypothetical protein